jgi:hypothetical protein
VYGSGKLEIQAAVDAAVAARQEQAAAAGGDGGGDDADAAVVVAAAKGLVLLAFSDQTRAEGPVARPAELSLCPKSKRVSAKGAATGAGGSLVVMQQSQSSGNALSVFEGSEQTHTGAVFLGLGTRTVVYGAHLSFKVSVLERPSRRVSFKASVLHGAGKGRAWASPLRTHPPPRPARSNCTTTPSHAGRQPPRRRRHRPA